MLTVNEMSLLTPIALWPAYAPTSRGPAVSLVCCLSQFHYASLQSACSESTGREIDRVSWEISGNESLWIYQECEIYAYCTLMNTGRSECMENSSVEP